MFHENEWSNGVMQECHYSSTPLLQVLKLLRDGFELIALDDVAHLIFVEVAQLDAAFETDADLFHIILETPERGQSAIVNWLAPPQHPRPSGPRNASIGNETA